MNSQLKEIYLESRLLILLCFKNNFTGTIYFYKIYQEIKNEIIICQYLKKNKKKFVNFYNIFSINIPLYNGSFLFLINNFIHFLKNEVYFMLNFFIKNNNSFFTYFF